MQVVIITGVAQGMGREVALRLAARGDVVAGFDVDAAGIESLRAELDAKGSESFLTTLDVCDRPGILAFRDEVLRADAGLGEMPRNPDRAFLGWAKKFTKGKPPR